jgi:RNA polymerase sigma-70 factor (TIGR02943 family)
MPGTTSPIEPAAIERERSYLLRYALLQLRNPAQAEDAVQETLLAALEGRDRFSGRSSLRTWLTGILKHKIIDHLRRSGRERPLNSADDDRSEADIVDALFADDGHWRGFPADWGSPAKALGKQPLLVSFRTVPAASAGAHRAGVHDARSDGNDHRRHLSGTGHYLDQLLGDAASRAIDVARVS